jgi:hypothetical protein
VRPPLKTPPKILRAAAILVATALFLSTGAQLALADGISARSVSGQFVIHAPPFPSPAFPKLENDPGFVRLELALLTVSCERIKQLLYRSIGANASWRGKVYLALYPARDGNESITITSEKYRDGWQYRVEMPDIVERRRYVRAMVEVLLLEYANRNAGEHSAEIPVWLVEGFSQELLASNEIEIILPPPHGVVNGLNLTSTTINARKTDPLEKARQQLRMLPPLTFDGLSWPAEDTLSGEAGQCYRLSAQLLATRLLDLKDGPASLRSMLTELPQHYNWQFAFLNAFRSYFESPRDAEKWWALQVVRFTGRDVAQTWPLAESLQKLEQTIRSPVQIRATSSELPLHGDASLQTIIREWDPANQTQVLSSTLVQLDYLRFQVTPQLISLLDDYRQTIRAYLQTRDQAGFFNFYRKNAAARKSSDRALAQLNELDARREAFRSSHEPIASASTSP